MRTQIPEETRKEIISARASGMRVNEIAKVFNIASSTVSNICGKAGFAKKRKSDGRVCPKCHRGPFPEEYTFCPFCTADMRDERELVIESLQRAKDKLRTPFDDTASSINYAIMKAIDYLKANRRANDEQR